MNGFALPVGDRCIKGGFTMKFTDCGSQNWGGSVQSLKHTKLDLQKFGEVQYVTYQNSTSLFSRF